MVEKKYVEKRRRKNISWSKTKDLAGELQDNQNPRATIPFVPLAHAGASRRGRMSHPVLRRRRERGTQSVERTEWAMLWLEYTVINGVHTRLKPSRRKQPPRLLAMASDTHTINGAMYPSVIPIFPPGYRLESPGSTYPEPYTNKRTKHHKKWKGPKR